MSLCVLSSKELLIAAKTHVCYVHDTRLEKFDLPEEKPVKTENEEQEPVVLPPGNTPFVIIPIKRS